MRCAVLLLLVSILGFLGCLGPESTECGGGVCPPALKCVIDITGPICAPRSCGDGVLDVAEACDDGNNLSGDGCPATCISDGQCGNGVVDPLETCDDANARDHDGCSSACALESPGWVSRASAPPERSGAAVAYDAVRGRLVMFGGCSALANAGEWATYCDGTLFDDTWEWDGARWSPVATAVRPTARFGHAMAFDVARQRIVLFGGCSDTTTVPNTRPCGLPLDDTWEWDGVSWIARAALAPPKRYGHSMVYDGARQVVLMVGGCLENGCVPGPRELDTWTWDGTAWTKHAVTQLDHYNWLGGLAFDPARGKVVLFGGADRWVPFAETWEWDGNDWTRRTPAVAPPARFNHGMAYDAGAGKVIVYGGCTEAATMAMYHCTTRAADTWEWDGSTWTERVSARAPPARNGHAMAYDAARDRIVVFGGELATGISRNDTWQRDAAGWREPLARVPHARSLYGAAYHEGRGSMVVFGGTLSDEPSPLVNDLWEWTGHSWIDRTAGGGPSARLLPSMAYDRARASLVLFGGCTGVDAHSCQTSDETWEWTSSGWTRRTPAVKPSARVGQALAYDAARGRLVLFGGCVGFGIPCSPSADTWEWDGASWSRRTPATSPPARWLHAMAYDSARGRLVVVGGLDATATPLGDTWEWDGTDWTPREAAPGARALAAASYDVASGKMVVFGGCTSVRADRHTRCDDAITDDVWTWNGTVWQIETATGPPARAGHVAVYDTARAEVVTFSGAPPEPAGIAPSLTFGTAAHHDTWAWDGSAWTLRGDLQSPRAAPRAQLAYDAARGVVVAFDGVTWEWNGIEWVRRRGVEPSHLRGPLAYDAARGTIVLFGHGAESGGNFAPNETWTWDGTAWTPRSPATTPPRRLWHAMAYDAAKRDVVVFGGIGGSGLLDDTWLWDGTNWRLAAPGTRPPARYAAAMAFDAGRNRIVMFGGASEVAPALGETWEWDGSDWLASAPSSAPPARRDAVLVYDSARERILLHGGNAPDMAFDDTWEWDGTSWTQLSLPPPPAYDLPGGAYDAARQQVVLLGSRSFFDVARTVETWFFRYEAARWADSCTTGFDGDLDGQVGCADPSCGGVCDPLCASLAQCEGDRPRCGDGACSTVESCRICPEDCGACNRCGDLLCDADETCPGDCGAP